MDLGLKRGLKNFINDVKGCDSKEAEVQRVQKEIVNIRQKFSGGKTLKSYDKKKYVWKLVYIFMLGYDVEFGHMEAVNLASSQDSNEKYVGYIALGVLMGTDDDLAKLVINTIRTDLMSKETMHQGLALNLLTNVNGKDLTEALCGEVLRLLENEEMTPYVRKKAALCVSRMYRIRSELFSMEELAAVLAPNLDQTTLHLDLTLSMLTLTYRLALRDPAPFVECAGAVVRLAEKIVLSNMVQQEYMYHELPAPFLQVLIFKFLQLYPIPSSQMERENITRVLSMVLGAAEKSSDINRMNAYFSVLIEGVNLVTHYGEALGSGLLEKSISHLANLISVGEPNIRYLGLAGMAKLAQSAQRDGLKGILGLIRAHHDIVKDSLKDADFSIRKKALDLMFSMCNELNAKTVVDELLNYLKMVSFVMKEETVLKIAILAERYASDYRWYLDIILHLISVAGDYVSDDIWHRAVQIVTNNPDLQVYAAQQMYDAIQSSHTHETTIKVGTYILGEFGQALIASDSSSVTEMQLFESINQHFPNVSSATRCMMFHAYIKLMHNFPEELREEVSLLLDAFRDSSDSELQQRACEYFAMTSLSCSKLDPILEPMPRFAENRVSAVIRAFEQAKLGGADDETKKRGPAIIMNVSPEKGSKVPPSAPVSSAHIRGPEGDREDLLGLEDVDSSPIVDKNIAGQQPVEGRVPIDRWMSNCLQEGKGLLFENEIIQIGVQHQYQGERGQMMLFFGNKTSQLLEGVMVEVKAQSSQLPLQSSQLPTEIAPMAQCRQSFTYTLMIPFSEFPTLNFKFRTAISGNKCTSVRLPISICHFGQAVHFSADEFSGKWDALGDKSQTSFSLSSLSSGLTDRAMKALSSLHFGAQLSEDMASIFAAITIRTGTVHPTTHQPALVGCMVRILLSGSSCNVRIRAVNPAVVENVKSALHAVLSQC